MIPETRYAKSGEVAYHVVGAGPIDLVFVPGWVSNIELFWEEPSLARFLERLASFSRLLLFDERGTGLSDRAPIGRLPTLEERMDDVRAVTDAAGSERAVLLGNSEGGGLAILFAATYPHGARAGAVSGCSPGGCDPAITRGRRCSRSERRGSDRSPSGGPRATSRTSPPAGLATRRSSGGRLGSVIIAGESSSSGTTA